MPFSETFRNPALLQSRILRRFAALIEPKSGAELETLAAEAEKLTRQNFGRTMRLFAPLYLSNECVNICKYCGFSRDNPILRVTLSVDQVEAEARHLYAQGFRNVLLVAGEHPKFVAPDYLAQCTARLREFIPAISLEVGPMETPDYLPSVQAGAEGLVVYQETYDRGAYAELHTAGPKRDFDWRLDCPERAYAAGFRRLGIGALFGLAPWHEEALNLAAHVDYLLRHCWKSSVTVSLPRLRPAAGQFAPRHDFNDRALVQVILALRLCFPQVGIVLSTREAPALRDRLARLGVTMMSAGSHTEPGGYTGAGEESIHQTQRGKAVAVIASEGEHLSATEQFAIADERSPAEVSAKLRELGLEPVWKDWDAALSAVD
ncbi:MAG TPA: 2-iminoacetate synthase ThiH [Candidatus Methylacidiphilales bacterium]|jgi:2-iminoacetate synthase|nr:2-iminoacetate synthase ThiH [Candidatus Methylacidiphilales bacterium]